MSIHSKILAASLVRPWRVAAVDDVRPWRSWEIVVSAMNLATILRRRVESQTVGVCLPTGGGFAVSALATWMIGRVVVPVNYLLKEEELHSVVEHCGCDCVVTTRLMADRVRLHECGVRLLHLEELSLGGLRGLAASRWPARAGDDDLAALLYTSGTSGTPKGVMLTHGNLCSNVSQIRRWVNFTRRDVLFGAVPQFHSFGFTVLTLLPLIAGCRVEYAARFVPGRIVRRIRDRRPTVMVATASMYNALLSVKDASADDLRSLRLVVSGGEPMPEAVSRRFEERFGIRIDEGYGLTETAPVTNWRRPDEFRQGSVGKALPDCCEKIVSLEDGRTLGPGEEGEIRIKGPNVMKGYYRDPAATREAFDEEGYFKTGDIGRIDLDGHLFITGRLKEMLIVGGENVFPREIEEVLNRHESVRASGVIGAPHPTRGEEPVAFVEINDGYEFDEAALRTWCRSSIAGYKTPRHVIAVEELPKGPTGKVLRRALRELLCQTRTDASMPRRGLEPPPP